MARDDIGTAPRQAAGGGAAAAAIAPPPRGIAQRLLRATAWLLGVLAALVAAGAALVALARADPEGWLADLARTAAARFEPFKRQPIARAGAPAPLPAAAPPPALRWPAETGADEASAERWLAERGTRALIVLRRGQVIHERYFDGHRRDEPVHVFSVAKVVVSALVGLALEEGRLASLDLPITDFLPELGRRDARFQAITLAHLMTMRTGIAFNEGYASPFSDVARWYLARDIGSKLARLEIRGAPGRRFAYQSGNTQLVAMALERALGMPLAAYAQSRLWQPMGAEFDAAWGSDHATPPQAKAFCCFVTTAIDLARFGQLHLDSLNALRTAPPGPKPLLPPLWVLRSTAVLDETRGTVNDIERRNIDRPFARQRAFFSHGWRRGVGPGGEPAADFHAQGLLGQHLLVAPQTQTVIVRLGTRQGGIYWPAWMSELAGLNP